MLPPGQDYSPGGSQYFAPIRFSMFTCRLRLCGVFAPCAAAFQSLLARPFPGVPGQSRYFHDIKHFTIQGKRDGERKLVRFQELSGGDIEAAKHGAFEASLGIYLRPGDDAGTRRAKR